MLKPVQIRAARGLLRWSASRLAANAAVHISTVQRMERGNGQVNGSIASLRKIQGALEAAGVEFLRDDEAPGVCLRDRA